MCVCVCIGFGWMDSDFAGWKLRVQESWRALWKYTNRPLWLFCGMRSSGSALPHWRCVIHPVHGIIGEIDFTSTQGCQFRRGPMYAKTPKESTESLCSNTNFWKMLFCLASRKLWINWQSTKPKTLATTPQGCAMHSRVSSFADPAPFEHLEVTCCVDPPCLERETGGFQPKRFMFQLFSHLHVAESASEIIWKINQRYFFTPIRHDYLASTVPIVTIRRLCGLPVVLASVGRVMRIGRWSQPRWEVTWGAGCFVSRHH